MEQDLPAAAAAAAVQAPAAGAKPSLPQGKMDDGPGPEGFTNPSDGGDQQRLHSL